MADLPNAAFTRRSLLRSMAIVGGLAAVPGLTAACGSTGQTGPAENPGGAAGSLDLLRVALPSSISSLPRGLEATGRVRVAGERVDDDPRARARQRGGVVSLLMQDPFTLLNPLRRAGRQIADGLPGGAAAPRPTPCPDFPPWSQ
ncbi:hypothetical protein [Streptosporangium sp. NPDC006007]|uniref:hypothetical protein n=1 Tax=Streptosporangium sp. NPDC006007 TaxID=3154575 RepID=UPI0033A2A0F9